MTLREAQSAFVKDISLLIAFAYAQGLELTFGEVFRTEYQQREYLRTGRSKTMNSRHLERLAVDFNFFKDGKMLFYDIKKRDEDLNTIKPVGDYWCSLAPENVWGADWNRNGVLDDKFKDPYHFERIPPK